MRILFAASEIAPYVKTGGLADVAASLPGSLRKHGHEVRCVMPEYGQISDQYKSRLRHICHFRTRVSWRSEYTGINVLREDQLPVYFIDNKYFFHRPTLYDGPDRHVAFAFFCRAILEMLPRLDFCPDIIHCHDWHTGPLGILLADGYHHDPFYKNIKTLFTIHNLHYQGCFGPETVDDVLAIDHEYWKRGIIRHNGLVNYMKMGIMGTDYITTVSPSYAREITTPQFGEGLDYALRLRKNSLSGILNGIDYDIYDPSTDPDISHTYDPIHLESKVENKRDLQNQMSLTENVRIPIIGIVSRLVEEKGWDLLAEIIDTLMQEEIQLVVLGSGDPHYEELFRDIGRRYPQKTAVNIRYDAALAKKIYAGSDLFLMPSRFEPCGLSQLISFRYGTVPVVREVGGLKDTVEPYIDGRGSGFVFSEYESQALLKAIYRAILIYRKQDEWQQLIQRIMNLDYSWGESARKYSDLYNSLLNRDS